MKKKLTDIFDDVPVEFLEEIIEDTKPKKSGRLSKWAAVLVLFICVSVGTVGYAYYKSHFLFAKYFKWGEEKLQDELMQNQYYEAKNKDYCLRVEDILSDGDVKNILVSVEALNDKSYETLKKTETKPDIRFSGGTGIPTASGGSITSYEDPEEPGKIYYMFEWNASASRCIVSYAENMPMFAGADWWEEHKDEILQISFRIKDKTEKVISISLNQNKFPEGIVFEKVEIRRMSVKTYGTSVETKEKDEEFCSYYYPTVTAILKDGTSVRLMQGNMGYENEKTDDVHSRGGGTYSTEETGEEIKVEITEEFGMAFDIDQIKKIRVNGVEYNINFK